MKQPNPLLPQGSFEAHARGKSHVRIAVFTILAIHVVVLGALLIQGCKRDDSEPIAAGDTNELGSIPPLTNAMPDVVMPGTATTAPPPAITSLPPVTPTTSTPGTTLPPVVPPAEAGTIIEHTIVRGDTYSSLSTKYGVSTRAIQNANPGIDPAKLQVGQKVKIPPKTVTETRNGTAATDAPDTYTVKSGDTLGKIATANGTTVRALQKLNNLTTTQIRVGQRLKLPPRAAPAPVPGTPAPAQ
jgi:LysM repeat protein